MRKEPATEVKSQGVCPSSQAVVPYRLIAARNRRYRKPRGVLEEDRDMRCHVPAVGCVAAALVTGSRRVADAAARLGLGSPLVLADSPDDAALTGALIRWREANLK